MSKKLSVGFEKAANCLLVLFVRLSDDTSVLPFGVMGLFIYKLFDDAFQNFSLTTTCIKSLGFMSSLTQFTI